MQQVLKALLLWTALIALVADLPAEDIPPEWEEALVERLTDEQMDEFLAGVDPAQIALGGGETLDDLLKQLEAQEREGLLFYPVTPCVLFDGSQVARLTDGETQPIWIRRDEKLAGEAICGAGIEDLTARVALLTVQVLEHEGEGVIEIGPGDRRQGSRLQLSPGASHGWTVTSVLCASNHCDQGNLRLTVEETSARVTIHLLGFYGTARPALEASGTLSNESPTAVSSTDSKSLESPFWEPGTAPGKIHYSDGFVGIGTDNPYAPLHVVGPDAEYPNNQALKINTYGERPRWDHVSITGKAASGYGLAFGGEGHGRGGIYARNVGGTSSAEGEITLWARSGGNIRLMGGKVGVGVTPQAKLHVKGDMRIDVGEGLRIQGGYYWGTNLDARKFRIRDGNDSNGNVDGGVVFETWTEKDDESFPLLTLRRREGTPRVGIGSAFPSGPLKIHGYRNRATGTLRSTGKTVWGTGTAFDSELRVGSEIIVKGQVRRVQEIVGADRIEINNAFIPEVTDETFWVTHRLMMIDGQGRMALGDLDPDDALDVEGDIQATGELEVSKIRVAKLPDDDSTPSNSSINLYSREQGGSLHRWALHSASIGGGWGVQPNSLTIWEYDGRGCTAENPVCEARMVFQPNTGNVGIGTDQPSARLDVDGDVRLSGSLKHAAELDIEAGSNMTLSAGGDICIGRCD